MTYAFFSMQNNRDLATGQVNDAKYQGDVRFALRLVSDERAADRQAVTIFVAGITIFIKCNFLLIFSTTRNDFPATKKMSAETKNPFSLNGRFLLIFGTTNNDFPATKK